VQYLICVSDPKIEKRILQFHLQLLGCNYIFGNYCDNAYYIYMCVFYCVYVYSKLTNIYLYYTLHMHNNNNNTTTMLIILTIITIITSISISQSNQSQLFFGIVILHIWMVALADSIDWDATNKFVNLSRVSILLQWHTNFVAVCILLPNCYD